MDTSATSPLPAVGYGVQALLTRARTEVFPRPGLRFETGSYARTVGIFRPVIEIDPEVLEEPPFLYEFCLIHEAAHAAGRHNLWRTNLAKWLLFPIYPLIVRYQEYRADREARKWMKGVDYAMALVLAHNEQHTWFGRFVYGENWIERFRRTF